MERLKNIQNQVNNILVSFIRKPENNSNRATLHERLRGEIQMMRWICGYDKKSEKLCIEVRLPSSVTTEILRAIFNLPESDPLYDCYPIDENRARLLQEHLDFQVPIDAYDCFLEASTDS